MKQTLNTVIKLALANLDLGLAETVINFLGTTIQEEFDEQKMIFHTQRDSKVDDKFCRPLEGEVFAVGDPFRPTIPDDLHINCRCFWEDEETGEILGQDGFFAGIQFGSADETKSTEDGKDGVWKTVRGSPVFFPDGEDPNAVISKRFKTPKKTKHQKDQERIKAEIQDSFDNPTEFVEHEPQGEVTQTVDVDGHDVEVGDQEEAVDAIDDFRDKNDLWEVTEKMPEDFKAKNDMAITRQGERLEDGLRETGDLGDNPQGSVFLTRSGDWVGFGGDTDHRMSISGAESYSGMKLEENRPEGNAWTRSDDLDKAMRISGVARVGVRDGVQVDISHPLSSSQRSSLENLVISKGISPSDIFFDKNNRAKDISDDSLMRSIGAFGSVGTADTFEGKEGVWRTVRGTPIFFPDGEDGDKIIAEKFNKAPTVQSPTSKSEKNVVRFPEARKKHSEFIKGREDQSYSFDPVTGKGFDAFDETQAKEMYKEYGNGSDPVYFISKTNHGGQLSRESESEYIEAFNEGKRPLIGHWVSDETGFDYTDVSFAESNISESQAKSLLQDNAQESALVLKPNGRVEFLDA